MRRRWTLVLTVAVAAAACSDTTATNTLLSDDEVTADLAASSGDAIAAALDSMLGNEAAGALPMVVSPDGPVGLAVTHERSRTCLDAGGNVVPNCSPMSSVRKVATQVAIHGTRSGTRTGRDGGTVDWSGAVHRVMVDTLTRNFNSAQPPAEVSRSHSGVATVNDTTTFSGDLVTRTAAETALDSVIAVTWNLPRSSNPWPVSGSIVRNTNVKLTLTRGDRTESRTMTRRVQVTFPADAQGNVELRINDKICSLNLVTRRVSNCQ
jgi:hypothetical protein